MKLIKIKNKVVGEGIQYIGWSGRGWADGGPVSAGPMSSKAPSWDELSREININMVRMGFTMNHFLPDDLEKNSLSQSVKKGMENSCVSWAKSQDTAYSYCLNRCQELGWKMLICVNPSLNKEWQPFQLTKSSDFLQLWESFCFHLARYVDENWPGMAGFFEITNEPTLVILTGKLRFPITKGFVKEFPLFNTAFCSKAPPKGSKERCLNPKLLGLGWQDGIKNGLREY